MYLGLSKPEGYGSTLSSASNSQQIELVDKEEGRKKF
jgi:hypothetical protein